MPELTHLIIAKVQIVPEYQICGNVVIHISACIPHSPDLEVHGPVVLQQAAGLLGLLVVQGQLTGQLWS